MFSSLPLYAFRSSAGPRVALAPLQEMMSTCTLVIAGNDSLMASTSSKVCLRIPSITLLVWSQRRWNTTKDRSEEAAVASCAKIFTPSFETRRWNTGPVDQAFAAMVSCLTSMPSTGSFRYSANLFCMSDHSLAQAPNAASPSIRTPKHTRSIVQQPQLSLRIA